jgi:hypothetical protein
MEDGRWRREKGKREKEKGKLCFIFPFPFPLFPATFFRDRRGAVTVQALLLLPLFVLVVFGGYEILRAMSVKQALHNGTYQAVRYLSLNPIISSGSGPWQDVAETLILQEMAAEAGDEALARRQLQVRVPQIPRHIPPWCGDRFRVEAFYTWEFEVPFANRFHITFRERYDGRVICS